MKQRNFDQFTQAVILNASQMAYLEDAQKTHTMLLRFNELFRYFIKPDAPVTLTEELKGLKNYIDIQMMRYGDRFNVTFPEDYNDNIMVHHLEIIDFFDNVLNNALVQYENSIKITIEIDLQINVCFRVLLCSDNRSEEFCLVLMKEGESIV